MIDLAPHMHDVRIDPAAKLAYVGGGCLWGHVDEALSNHGECISSLIVIHAETREPRLGNRGWGC